MSPPSEPESGQVSYTFVATDTFWKNFYDLCPEQKESTRKSWAVFKENPFHPSLRTHKISALSAKAGTTVYGVEIEGDLRVVFLIREAKIVTLDIGTHSVYKKGIPIT